MTMLASPCVNICRLDAGGTVCIGCWRSTDEIARWTAMSDAERDAVMASLAGRRQAHGIGH